MIFKLHEVDILYIVIDVGIAGVRCMYHPPPASKCLKLKFCLLDEEVLFQLEVDTYATVPSFMDIIFLLTL